jgi:hypothetical protein
MAFGGVIIVQKLPSRSSRWYVGTPDRATRNRTRKGQSVHGSTHTAHHHDLTETTAWNRCHPEKNTRSRPPPPLNGPFRTQQQVESQTSRATDSGVRREAGNTSWTSAIQHLYSQTSKSGRMNLVFGGTKFGAEPRKRWGRRCGNLSQHLADMCPAPQWAQTTPDWRDEAPRGDGLAFLANLVSST